MSATIRRVILTGSVAQLLGVLAGGAGAEPPATRDAPASQESPDADTARLGIVVRLSEQLFDSPRAEISHAGRISETIAGVHTIGTAWTSGDLHADFRTKRDGVAMDLVFVGTSTSQSVASPGPVRIHATTTTRIDVRTPILFTLAAGFQAGHAVANAQDVRTCRQVVPQRGGLPGLIARRIAERRMRQQQHQIRRASEQATRKRVSAHTRQQVDAQLSQWNARYEPLRQLLISQSWLQQEPVVRYASDEAHLILFIEPAAPQGAADTAERPAVEFPPARLPDGVAGGLVDVIFYPAADQAESLEGLLTFVEMLIDEQFAERPIAERISLETMRQSEYVMLSVMQDQTPAPRSAATP